MDNTYFSEEDRIKPYHGLDAVKYFYFKLIENNLLYSNRVYLMLMLKGIICWIYTKSSTREQVNDFLDYCNEKFLLDLNLDSFPENKDRHFLNVIKNKRYHCFGSD